MNKLISLLTESANQPLEENLHNAEAFFNNIINGLLGFLPTILAALIILLVGLIISKLVLKMMKKGMDRPTVDKTVANFSYSVVKIVIYVVLATIVLAVLGVPMSCIIAVVGTAGVAIGLALQNSLSNVAGGFTIMLNKPIKIGDYVLAEGEEGTVEVINIWYTQLKTVDNKTVFIPNGQLAANKIVNFSTSTERRVDLTFNISYENDFNEAFKVLRDIADAHEKILKNPPVVIRVLNHGENALQITFRAWVKTDDYWDVYFDINEQAKMAFDEKGIEIPYSQVVVRNK